MPNSLTRTMINMVKYWPTLYHCRADVLDRLFLAFGTEFDWKDGLRTDGLNTAQREEEFKRLNKWERYVHFRWEDKLNPLRFCPDRKRTPQGIERILQDRRSRAISRTPKQRENALRHKMYPPKEPILHFHAISTHHSPCCTVPDNVRPEWLAGIRETLYMVIAWDTEEQVTRAKKCIADLEERFGPVAQWHKRKRKEITP